MANNNFALSFGHTNIFTSQVKLAFELDLQLPPFFYIISSDVDKTKEENCFRNEEITEMVFYSCESKSSLITNPTSKHSISIVFSTATNCLF